MATPPGGPSSYGSGRSGQPEDVRSAAAPGGDAPFLNRFNFPSAPSENVQRPAGGQQPTPGGQPPQHGRPPQHAGQSPYGAQPPQRHPQPQEPQQQNPQTRIQPVQPGHADRTAGTQRAADQPPPPQQPLVRPYAMTGGRTRPRYQLAIEALVHTTAENAQLQGQLPEHQRICRLCYEIKSVAEISALLTIPLGVARILVADLAEAGLVAIHQPGGDETTADGQPDVTLLERVLSGLRKL
ncbi:DUF742 domain-containing protein [Streptomyces sp. WMMB303]|uniref:DUF742 domain-containing protein n=1 Tax=Streptomyces sp. WMMB303 TaxID=3034154 RepID=UPI0023EB3E12|nr:DUF742 domain-containing protein [Streptomyces sp. WMMB303]MDF4253217.1 DUF742 domain-containing protein [Streptomyces sp. WMMB303]